MKLNNFECFQISAYTHFYSPLFIKDIISSEFKLEFKLKCLHSNYLSCMNWLQFVIYYETFVYFCTDVLFTCSIYITVLLEKWMRMPSDRKCGIWLGMMSWTSWHSPFVRVLFWVWPYSRPVSRLIYHF